MRSIAVGGMVGDPGFEPGCSCSQNRGGAVTLVSDRGGAHDEDRTRQYRIDSAAPSPAGSVR